MTITNMKTCKNCSKLFKKNVTKNGYARHICPECVKKFKKEQSKMRVEKNLKGIKTGKNILSFFKKR